MCVRPATTPNMPPHATLSNLLDLSEQADADAYCAAVLACARDPLVDGILVIYSPKLDGAPAAVARAVCALNAGLGKPPLTCWMGDQQVAPARRIINAAGLATFRTPEAAVNGFSNIASFYQNQQLLQQTPPPLSQPDQPDLDGARLLIEGVLAEPRKMLTEMESKALLAAFHIPITQTILARGANEAMLGDWRGAPPAQREAVEHMLLRVSEMVCALPQLREMDINPLIVDEHGALAVDARIVIDHAPPATHNYAHLAILPYPSNYTQEWPMRGGGRYTLRPVQPDDASMLQELVRRLSEKSRYYRFASSLRELSVPMLARYTLIGYDREMAMVAVQTRRAPGPDGEFVETSSIIGVSRYIANPDRSSCEFSLLVDDRFSGQGLGTRLMLAIMDVARDKGLSDIDGLVLCKNSGMLKLMASLGFQIRPYTDDPDFRLCSKPL
ncbi:GNAT superfamily N-acetyltransferase [Janthinobacterium sp. CG_S6]|nr:GNAT superfamily N-acetyltransferase [Janthinobacterium sp. CG_S6]